MYATLRKNKKNKKKNLRKGRMPLITPGRGGWGQGVSYNVVKIKFKVILSRFKAFKIQKR